MTDRGARTRRCLGVATTVVVVAGFSALVAATCFGENLHPLALPDNPLQGRALFADRGCQQCHRLAGSKTGIGPNLGEGHFDGTFLELGADLWNHVPGMSVSFDVSGVPWPQLSERETLELVVFLNYIEYLGTPGRAETGRRIFDSSGCSRCHSVGGGKAHTGPDLADLDYFASPLILAQQIWNHGPSMLDSMLALGISPPEFEAGDLADLSAFVRQQAAPVPRARSLAAPGNPNRGAELFVGKGCAICHGTDARGGRSGPNLGEVDLHRSAEGIAADMWNHAIAMRSTMNEMGLAWPELQEAELADLASFLYSLSLFDPLGDESRGQEVFAVHGCAECHGEGADAKGPSLDGSASVKAPTSLVSAMWNHAPTMKRSILNEGRRWPQLTGRDLRDLLAFFEARASDE